MTPDDRTRIDRQPRLRDRALLLRPLQPEDWAELYEVASDPLIWALHPARDRWQEPVFREYFEQALASGGALVAIDPADGRIIGSSRYDFGRCGPGEMEIGWTFLARRYWGGQTNALMKRLMLAHAMRYVARVIFVVGEHNRRSRRAMEKIGGRLTERIIDAPQGRHVVYAIDRDAFGKGPLMNPIRAEKPTAPAGMFSYACIGVADLERAKSFYDVVMATLGHRRCDTSGEAGWEDWAGWGTYEDQGRIQDALWICRPFNGQAPHPGNGTMLALRASSWQQVREFHAAVLANGGSSEGEPGLRLQYNPDFYAAYVRDPDGNKLAVVCRGCTAEP